MKVLFLDFDGVLNLWPNPSKSGQFNKVACMNLESLLNKIPDLKIVVSSSWRTFGLEAVKDILKSNGIDPRRVLDITGDETTENEDNARGIQVEYWLKRNPQINNFVILDDQSDFVNLKQRLVQTKRYIGLTQGNVEKVMELLEKQ